MRQKCLLIISEKIKKIRGETTSPYKFINENHTYITCLFKKKGKRKGKEITRPILSSNSRDAIRRDSSVNEWKINTTIVAVDSSKEKGEEKKREREKRRKIAIDRSRCAVAVKSTGKLPARARPAELFFKRDRNSRRRKKRPGDGGEFREIRTPPSPLPRNSNGRCSNTNSKRSRRWSCNNEEEHPLDPLPITGCGLYLLFLYFSLHHSKFHLRPWRSSHRKIYALVDRHAIAKMLLLYSLSLSLCP